jgi:predicted GNAT family acetyltransferase
MIIIRNAIVSDASVIVDFQLAMALETEQLTLDKELVTKGVEAVFKDKEKGRYFVAEEENKVIASLMLTPEWSDWRNKTIWWIQSVYVVPEFRGKKVFSKLYQHVKETIIKDEKAAGLRLYVDLTNQNAREVYKAIGMNGEHYQLFEWMKGQ